MFLGEGVTWPDLCCSRSGRGARGTSPQVGWPKEAGAGTPREIRPKFMNVPDPRSQGSNACEEGFQEEASFALHPGKKSHKQRGAGKGLPHSGWEWEMGVSSPVRLMCPVCRGG